MALYGRFRFGSIRGVISMRFTLSRGTVPSICSITVPPTPNLDLKPKKMTITDGVRTVGFSGCIINDVSPGIDDDGHERWNITIVDRRWRWKYGVISGRYNIRSGGVIRKETKKSVRDLAKLIFDEMGEKNVDLSKMPNDTFPHFDWTDPVAPNVALDQVCQAVNCHVVPTTKDTFAVYPDGMGLDLPRLPNSSRGLAFDFAAGPGEVVMMSAPAQWQINFDLIPVGLDKGNEIRPIWDLSYMPKDEVTGERTWEFEEPPQFLNVETKYRKLAQETVWRWYQILPPGWVRRDSSKKKVTIEPGRNGMLKMPGPDLPIKSWRQFFPLLDHQLDYQQIPHVDRSRISGGEFDPLLRARKPAQVLGIFYDEQGRGADNYDETLLDQIGEDDSNEADAESPLIYQKGFTIDQDRGLVIFADPVYRFVDILDDKGRYAQAIGPAVIFLRCATNFYDVDTRAPWRRTMSKKVPGAPDPKAKVYHQHADAVPEYVTRFDWSNYKWRFDKNAGNLKDVDERLKLYLGYSMRKYEIKVPGQARYPILVEYAPDGLIAQVSWEISGTGTITTNVSKEREEITNMPSYDERRQALQLKNTLDQLQAQATHQDVKKDGR